MVKNQPGAAQRLEVLARELGLPPAVVRHSIRRLKELERVDSARPVAPTLTSRDLARMILALSAPMPVQAPLIEGKLGSLPRTAGTGALTAEVELVDLLDEAASRMRGDLDFGTGDILLDCDGNFAMFSLVKTDGTTTERVYRRGSPWDGMNRVARIQIPTIRRIALELLGA